MNRNISRTHILDLATDQPAANVGEEAVAHRIRGAPDRRLLLT
jgi:hypothetical protein